MKMFSRKLEIQNLNCTSVTLRVGKANHSHVKVGMRKLAGFKKVRGEVNFKGPVARREEGRKEGM